MVLEVFYSKLHAVVLFKSMKCCDIKYRAPTVFCKGHKDHNLAILSRIKVERQKTKAAKSHLIYTNAAGTGRHTTSNKRPAPI